MPALLAGQVDAGRLAEAEARAPTGRSARCPSRRPILIAPTLLDCARICAVVSVSSPRACGVAGSCGRRPGSAAARSKRRVGRDEALLRARPATVNGLERRARLVGRSRRRGSARAYGGAPPRSLASTRGQLASARISPVRGSITIAVAPFGLVASAPTPASTASTRSWIVASSVSCERRCPAASGCVVARSTIGWPSASLTIAALAVACRAAASLSRVLEARRGPCRRCRPCRAPARPASRAGRCGGWPGVERRCPAIFSFCDLAGAGRPAASRAR